MVLTVSALEMATSQGNLIPKWLIASDTTMSFLRNLGIIRFVLSSYPCIQSVAKLFSPFELSLRFALMEHF